MAVKLGKSPDFESDDGSVRLFCGDALAVLPGLDLADTACITDPPLEAKKRLAAELVRKGFKFLDTEE